MQCKMQNAGWPVVAARAAPNEPFGELSTNRYSLQLPSPRTPQFAFFTLKVWPLTWWNLGKASEASVLGVALRDCLKNRAHSPPYFNT